MTEQQIKQATIAIWKMRQPAFIHRQRQVEARREIEHRRLNQAFYAAIGTAGDEDKHRELELHGYEAFCELASQYGQGKTE